MLAEWPDKGQCALAEHDQGQHAPANQDAAVYRNNRVETCMKDPSHDLYP